MRRTFVTNLALVLVLNLLVKPFYILGIDAEVQVRVGTSAYGDLAALMSLSFLLNILLDLGITNWNTRHIAQNTGEMRQQVGRLITLRGLLALLYLCAIFLVAFALGYRGQQLHLLGILALNQVLAASLLYLRSNIAGAQRFAQDSLLSVLDRVLLILICAWLLWSEPFCSRTFQVEWFVWAQTAAYGAAVVVAFILVSVRGGMPSFRWDAAFARSVLKQCLPYALLVLLMTFYYRTDTVMLERLLPDGALHAGIYAQGFRFFEALNMLGFLLAGLLLPMFSRMLKESQDVNPLTGLALRLVIAGTGLVAVLGSFYGEGLMDLRYDAYIAESAQAFTLMVWSFSAVCITYIYGTLLTAGGDLRSLNIMAAGGMVLNIGMNLALIPHFGVMGAAVSGVTTQVLTAVAQVFIAKRKMQLNTPLKPVLRGLLYLTSLIATGYVCRRMDLGLYAATAILSVAALGLATALGLLPVSHVLKLLARAERA